MTSTPLRLHQVDERFVVAQHRGHVGQALGPAEVDRVFKHHRGLDRAARDGLNHDAAQAPELGLGAPLAPPGRLELVHIVDVEQGLRRLALLVERDARELLGRREAFGRGLGFGFGFGLGLRPGGLAYVFDSHRTSPSLRPARCHGGPSPIPRIVLVYSVGGEARASFGATSPPRTATSYRGL